MTLRYHGDISDWTFKGQIRQNWLYIDPTPLVLADFVVGTVTTDTVDIDDVPTLVTYIPVALDESITIDIPLPPKKRSSTKEPAKPGANVWVYDIFGTDTSSNRNLLVQGYVEIAPIATAI